MSVTAQENTLKHLTLEELNYGGDNYRDMLPERRNYQWWGDKLLHVESNKVSTVDMKTSRESTLFTLAEVQSWVSSIGESINKDDVSSLSYVSFPDKKATVGMLVVGDKRVLFDWKQHSASIVLELGDYSELEYNEVSHAAALLKDNNLYLRTAEGKNIQLSTDGSREIVYGQSVHRNEFGIMKGTFFSPDGKKLAFYRMDQSMVTDYPQVNVSTVDGIAQHCPDKHPMAGETSHKVTIGIATTEGSEVVWLDLGDVTDRYFTNLQWSPDGNVLYVIELNRDQTDQHLDAYDAATGKKIKTLYTEHNDNYTEPLHPIEFLPWDDSKFVLWSERDGYWHLYLMDTDGREICQITKGNWVVMDLLGFNTKEKSVVITSRELSPIQQNLFAVNIATGERKLLDDGKGYHSALLSASGEYVLDVCSEPDVPRAWNVKPTTLKGKKALCLGTASDPWQGYDVPQIECGSIKAADGVTDLYYRMVRPHDFDPNKKYPAIVYVYGGPHARNVDASWHYMMRGWEPYMANKGYVIFILDNRGSCDRGRDFEQATFRQLGQIEMQDQMKGVDYLCSLPYIDKDKLGVHGWSFGGFMTTSLMTNYPDVFKVGVAGGPVIDWKWYEVMYGERYMDTPEQNPEGYEKTSLLNKAGDLKGKLLIITGYNDNTVVPQHCLSFLEACIDAGTQPDFFAYPGEEHNMRGRRSVHLHEKITQYFLDYLK